MRVIIETMIIAFVAALTGCTCNGTLGQPCTTATDCLDDEICLNGQCQPNDTDSGTGLDGGGDSSTDCTDNDGDGFGVGSGCHGPDCDDSDPVQTGVEVCDGHDNDCDGEVDEGVLSSCGDCDPSCTGDEIGVGTDDPFDLDDDENEGVVLDEEGAIVLDSHSIDTDFIWIANTGAGEVVKVDTDTYEEVGRYVTGPDPSRTSVNTAGDVYVGNRAGLSLTKISVLGEGCPDTNGDGIVTTSAGGGDVLPYGDDDCMLWRTELPDNGVVRAVAAHDEFEPDGALFPYVWVGGWDGVIYKLDGNDGSVILRTESPIPPYGFALDAAGNLWIGTNGNTIGRLDTTRCRDEASCEVEICSGESAECDEAVKQSIPLPLSGYGITVDFMQRVWIAGSGIMRYEPSALIGERFTSIRPGFSCNGIGADALGFAYAACQGNSRIVRVDADDMESWVDIETAPNRGIGIDADGKIWGINRASDIGSANVITPGLTVEDNETVVGVGPILSSPYTYSDMTGTQLRLATNPRGWYRAVYEGCLPTIETEWGILDWVAEVPGGTTITVRVRTADTRDELEAAEWHVVATVPPDAPPVHIGDVLAGEGVEVGRFLMVEFILQAERTSVSEVITPRILSIEQQFICPVVID